MQINLFYIRIDDESIAYVPDEPAIAENVFLCNPLCTTDR